MSRQGFRMRNSDWAVLGVAAAVTYVGWRQWRMDCFLSDVMKTARSLPSSRPQPRQLRPQMTALPSSVPPRHMSERDRLLQRLHAEEEEKGRRQQAPQVSQEVPSVPEEGPTSMSYQKGDPRSLGAQGGETATLLSANAAALEPRQRGKKSLRGRGGPRGATVQFPSTQRLPMS